MAHAGHTLNFTDLRRLERELTVLEQRGRSWLAEAAQPSFATYANTRGLAAVGGDQGPEGIEFVPEEASPNGKPLLLVGNETSKTVTVFQVNRVRR